MIDRLVLGGVEKTALEQVFWLREIGVECILLVLKRDANTPAAFQERLAQVPLEFLDDRLPRLMRTSVRVPGFYFFSVFHLLYALLLPMWVRSREWDLIISHNSYTTLSAWTLSKIRRIPYCMYLWDPIASVLVRAYVAGPINTLRAVLLPIGRFVDRVLVRGARDVFLSSHSYEEYVTRLLPARESPQVVPPGCYPAATPRDNTGDRILAATSWKEGKNLEVLLRAMAEVKASRAVIAGRWLHPSYRKRIDDMIDQLGLADRIEFTGEYDEARLARLARAALCMVTMNAELGFGMPSLEAAAQGCAFVCPRISGVAAYFREGHEAFYYDEGDSAGLAAVLRPLLGDPARARQAGMAAWQRARSMSWSQHAGAIANAIGRAPTQVTT